LYCGFGLLARLVIVTTGHQASPLWLSQETNFTEKKLCFFKKMSFFQNFRMIEFLKHSWRARTVVCRPMAVRRLSGPFPEDPNGTSHDL
jgi:hypothetical protein